MLLSSSPLMACCQSLLPLSPCHFLLAAFSLPQPPCPLVSVGLCLVAIKVFVLGLGLSARVLGPVLGCQCRSLFRSLLVEACNSSAHVDQPLERLFCGHQACWLLCNKGHHIQCRCHITLPVMPKSRLHSSAEFSPFSQPWDSISHNTFLVHSLPLASSSNYCIPLVSWGWV